MVLVCLTRMKHRNLKFMLAGNSGLSFVSLNKTSEPKFYTGCPKKIVPFLFFFPRCPVFVESGVSCTDCYQILLVLIEIPAVPVGTTFSRWRPPNNRRHFVLWNTQRQRPLSQFNATFGDSLRSIRRTVMTQKSHDSKCC